MLVAPVHSPDGKCPIPRPRFAAPTIAPLATFHPCSNIAPPFPRSSVMQVPYANTTNFSVSYDSTFTGGSNPNGLARSPKGSSTTVSQEPLHFMLETHAELPEGSRISLQVPRWIGEQLKPHQPPVEEFDDPKTDADNRRRLRIPVSPSGSHTLGTVQLPGRTAAASHMLVHIPPKRHHQPAQDHHPATLQRPRGGPVHLGLAS